MSFFKYSFVFAYSYKKSPIENFELLGFLFIMECLLYVWFMLVFSGIVDGLSFVFECVIREINITYTSIFWS